MPGKVNIDGSYVGTIIGGGYKVSGGWLNLKTGWQRNNGVWSRVLPTFSGSPGAEIPAGGIVPWYSTGTTPTGWSLYSDADMLLKGWDGTLGTVESTGGDREISFSTTTDGAHTGTASNIIGFNYVNSYTYTQLNNSSAGGHSHVATDDSTSNPAYMKVQLIQADSKQTKLPAKAVVFGNSISNLTEIITDSHYINIYSNSGADGGTTVSGNLSSSFTTNTVANHTHGSHAFPYIFSGYTGNQKAAAGGHSHIFSITDISWNLQSKILKAFTNIYSDFPARSGSIIGWTSTTAPDGWKICDGTDDTIDLRDYFLCCDSNGTYGATSGDNTVTFSYTTDTAGMHNHLGSVNNNYISASRYHGDSVSHSHSGSQNFSQQYPYLQLVFIQAD